MIDPATGKFRSGVGRRYDPENWQDHIFRVGKKYSAGVKISGGSDKTTYFTSINYLNDEGYYIRSKYSRLTATTNLDYSPKKWLTANFKAMYAYSRINNVGQSDVYLLFIPYLYIMPTEVSNKTIALAVTRTIMVKMRAIPELSLLEPILQVHYS